MTAVERGKTFIGGRATVISEPGSYVLGSPISLSENSIPAAAIMITADNVTLDLNGQRITGPGIILTDVLSKGQVSDALDFPILAHWISGRLQFCVLELRCNQVPYLSLDVTQKEEGFGEFVELVADIVTSHDSRYSPIAVSYEYEVMLSDDFDRVEYRLVGSHLVRHVRAVANRLAFLAEV